MPFLRFLSNDIDMAELLRRADTADSGQVKKRQCDLNYYLGMWSLIRQKDSAAARVYFQKSLESGLDLRMEYQRAKHELARLDSLRRN